MEQEIEATRLMRIVEIALANYNLEMGMSDFKELPLNDEITLDSTYTSVGSKSKIGTILNGMNGDNIVVYAVTKFSVVTTTGERIKFLKLDLDDIYTLQDIISDEYDIDIPEVKED